MQLETFHVEMCSKCCGSILYFVHTLNPDLFQFDSDDSYNHGNAHREHLVACEPCVIDKYVYKHSMTHILIVFNCQTNDSEVLYLFQVPFEASCMPTGIRSNMGRYCRTTELEATGDCKSMAGVGPPGILRCCSATHSSLDCCN